MTLSYTPLQLLYIFVEINNGRGNHGGFLRAFADCYCRADDNNVKLLHEAATLLVYKYGLQKYLPSESETSA